LCSAIETDLSWFKRCTEVEFAPWIEGEFTTVGRLAKSVVGEVQYLNTKEGTGVVAKVMPTDKVSRTGTTDERLAWLSEGEVPTVEDPWNEIAVLTFLQRSAEQCDFLLKLLGVFQDPSSTYVMTEYCDGGELFELVAYGDMLSAEEVRRYVTQLLQAVQHLHGHNVGHRDISLENVLLRRGNCVLMDFGQAVRLRTMDGVEFRYFAEAGKRMYRSPEMYVPRERCIQVVCPSDAVPGTVAQISYDRCRCEVLLPPNASPGTPCRAEPYGYAVAPADLFACGVCAFVMAVGKPPWNVARDLDPTFSFIRRHGMPALLRQWRSGLEPTHEEDSLLADLLRVNPKERPSIETCLRSPWLSQERGEQEAKRAN
jgi:serine/threonine protein kinase